MALHLFCQITNSEISNLTLPMLAWDVLPVRTVVNTANADGLRIRDCILLRMRILNQNQRTKIQRSAHLSGGDGRSRCPVDVRWRPENWRRPSGVSACLGSIPRGRLLHQWTGRAGWYGRWRRAHSVSTQPSRPARDYCPPSPSSTSWL